MASLSFLFSGRLPLETTIRGGFRVMWAFGLDGLVPLEPLELGVRQDLAIMNTQWVVGKMISERSVLELPSQNIRSWAP